MKPENWPDTLKVFGNGGGYDGVCLGASERFEDIEYLKLFLHDVGDTETDPDRWTESSDWGWVEWDEDKQCYCREGFDRPRPGQSELRYQPDDLNYLPDTYDPDLISAPDEP